MWAAKADDDASAFKARYLLPQLAPTTLVALPVKAGLGSSNNIRKIGDRANGLAHLLAQQPQCPEDSPQFGALGALHPWHTAEGNRRELILRATSWMGATDLVHTSLLLVIVYFLCWLCLGDCSLCRSRQWAAPFASSRPFNTNNNFRTALACGFPYCHPTS